jgi:SNF2 family DNA or RNA helicase
VSHDGLPSEEIVQAAGKMRVLDKLLKKLYERGHRVVLFSQYTRTLDMYVHMLLLSEAVSHNILVAAWLGLSCTVAPPA